MFLEDEKLVGTVLLDLRSKINSKRLNLQMIGKFNYIVTPGYLLLFKLRVQT